MGAPASCPHRPLRPRLLVPSQGWGELGEGHCRDAVATNRPGWLGSTKSWINVSLGPKRTFPRAWRTPSSSRGGAGAGRSSPWRGTQRASGPAPQGQRARPQPPPPPPPPDPAADAALRSQAAKIRTRPEPREEQLAQTRPSGRGEPERGGGPLGAPTERAGGSSMARVVVNARPLVAVRRVVLMPRAANRRLSVASGGLAGFALRFKVARDAFLLPDGTQGYRKPRVLFCCCFV